MNDLDRDKIKHATNTEIVRRILIKYFMSRGFAESFDKSVNPTLIQDLPYAGPGLDSKLEVEPHALEIDPTTSRGILGWNLFVLGNQRMFLGETHHANLLDLARQIKTGRIMPETILTTSHCTTPKRIITFIERVLGNHRSGYIDLTQRSLPIATRPKAFRPLNQAGSQEAQFYSRSFGGG